MTDVARWLRDYAKAWEGRDAAAAVDLFTDDASYRSSPFKEPYRNRSGVAAYWEMATIGDSDIRVRFGEPIVDGDRAAVEWWTTLSEGDAGPTTIAGILLLVFASDGRCSDLHECYARIEGHREPPDGWGRLAGGQGSGAAGALRFAEIYERAWRALDPTSVAGLFADDVVYRSHPFREPHRGADGALEYTREAYAQEWNADPRFALWATSGPTAVLEYWATAEEEGTPSTLVGADVLLFDDDGKLAELREYWNLEPVTVPPFPGWGA